MLCWHLALVVAVTLAGCPGRLSHSIYVGTARQLLLHWEQPQLAELINAFVPLVLLWPLSADSCSWLDSVTGALLVIRLSISVGGVATAGLRPIMEPTEIVTIRASKLVQADGGGFLSMTQS